jgi:diguanylate cyclase (GGDEF)-like protein
MTHLIDSLKRSLTGPEIPSHWKEINIPNLAVQRTLAEQMGLTIYEIENRKRLLGLDEEKIRALTDCRDGIHQKIDSIVEEFYSIQIKTPEVALIIGDIDTLARLTRAMRGYIMEMFGGLYDEAYVNTRLRVGKLHKRSGVSPKLYTTALRILHSLLRDEVKIIFGGDIERTDLTQEALNTIFMFDMQFVFDTYIGSLVAEVEAGRSEIERYALSLEDQIRDRTRQIEEMSRQDMLTGLINQRGFHEHLRRECSAVERGSDPLSLIVIDLNDFKQINDSKGHPEGDRVLTEVAKIVRQSARDTDISCRYGGDEFAILMPHTAQDDAAVLARRIITNLGEPNIDGLSFSIGIAVSAAQAPLTPSDLIKAADDAMYKAKLSYREDLRSHFISVTKAKDVQLATVVESEPKEAVIPTSKNARSSGRR